MTAYTKAAVIAAMIAAIFWAGAWVGSSHVQGQWNAEKVTIAQEKDKAIIQRVAENQALIEKYAADNAAITKAKNEEIASVRTALAISLRRGAGICSGSSAPAKADPARSSDEASAASEPFRDDIQRDIGAALMEMEEVAATARACQSFVRSNL